ncbi:MAG: hypothetical protein Q4P15_11425 [Propionibacteriaceae bacterium]|nr:hypothetical protein [Propionibacteriaceae bacterium]
MPWGGPPPGFTPPESAAPRPWAGIGIGVVAALVAVALVLGFAAPILFDSTEPAQVPTAVPMSPLATPVQRPTGTPTLQPSTPPPSPTRDAMPEPGAAQWQLPESSWEPLPTPAPEDELWKELQAFVFLDAAPAVLVGCPEPQTVETEGEFRQLVREQWHCVHAAWLPEIEAMGWSSVEPAVEFYAGAGATSECGYLDAPAFYCSSGDGRAYFGSGHMDMAMEWDLSINEMVNHEYGHHLQNLAGITLAKLMLEPSNEIERRTELQATCWSAAMTRNSRDVAFSEVDWDSWQQRLETMVLDGVHGSRESIRYWGTRGLYAETMGDCNTWAVEASEVS